MSDVFFFQQAFFLYSDFWGSHSEMYLTRVYLEFTCVKIVTQEFLK